MGGTPELLNLFQAPAVALLYYMIVVLISYAALFMALELRTRQTREKGAGRYAAASIGVALTWMALMIGALATLVTRNSPALVLPPLERAVSVLVILLVTWAFVTSDYLNPEPVRPKSSEADELIRRSRRRDPVLTIQPDFAFNVLTGVGIILTVAAYAVTAIRWTAQTVDLNFTATVYNALWLIGILVLCLFGIVVTVRGLTRITDAPLKIIFYLPIAISAGYGLYAYSTGNIAGADPGVMRLGFLASMPILAVIVYRFVIGRMRFVASENARNAAESASKSAMNNLIAENVAERDSAALIKALGTMLEREQPEDLPQQISVAVAGALRVDLCALFILTDDQFADVLGAYDNINHRLLTAMAVKRSEQPAMELSIAENHQQLLTTEANLNELVDLYTRLDIRQVGPAYVQPLSKDGQVIGVMVVALPFTRRLLKDSETRLLEALAPAAARLLLISRHATQRRIAEGERLIRDMVMVEGEPNAEPNANDDARAEMQTMMTRAREQINDLNAMVRNLQIELDYERGRMLDLGFSSTDPEGATITQKLETIQRERIQLEIERESLATALKEAQNQLMFSTTEGQDLIGQTVDALSRERDELQSQKGKLEEELSRLRALTGNAAPGVLRDMLTRLSEDRARLELERDAMKRQLTDAEFQLEALGIEGGTPGVVNTVVQLMDERSRYKAMLEKAQEEKNALLEERQRGITTLTDSSRDQRLGTLETELRRLAESNEILTRQRDAVRAEKEAVREDKDKSESQRAQMVAEMSYLQSELEAAVFERNRALNEHNRLLQERAQLTAQYEQLTAERATLLNERDQLSARIEGNRETLQQLGSDAVGSLQAMITDLSAERADLDARYQAAVRDLERSGAEISRLQSQLSRSVQVPPSVPVDSSTAEVMLSIAQELRTPMSSIGAYVDLLMGESVGLLGASQRQFLQRVKANSDRLATLIEDLVRITALDTGQVRLRPEEVDMDDVIDDAITATRYQFRERGITLRLDRPGRLPRLRGDRDSLQQIVLNLLSNAYLASPPDTEVIIQAHVERDFPLSTKSGKTDRQNVLILSVTDVGGGIPAEEQSRVFSRLYRADNPLIQGLGDTGVGLSIARALTEMHAGRIWLESTEGESSTFHVALPIESTREVPQVDYAATA